MRKIILVLSIFVLIISVAACGNSEKSDSTSSDSDEPIIESSSRTGYSFNMNYKTYGENLQSLAGISKINWEKDSDSGTYVYDLVDSGGASLIAVPDSSDGLSLINISVRYKEQVGFAPDVDMEQIGFLLGASYPALGINVDSERVGNAIDQVVSTIPIDGGYSDILYAEDLNVSVFAFVEVISEGDVLINFIIQAGNISPFI